MNKFDNLIAEYYKKHNIIEQTTPGLQTGNIATDFLKNFGKKVIAPFDWRTKDYLLKLNTSIAKLKQESKPNYNTAILTSKSLDKTSIELMFLEEYLQKIVQFFATNKKMPTAADNIKPHDSIKSNSTVKFIDTLLTNNNINDITNLLNQTTNQISLRKIFDQSTFKQSPPPDANTDISGAINAFNQELLVVYAVETFNIKLLRNEPAQFSLLEYLTKSDKSARDFLASNLTLDTIVKKICTPVFGKNVTFISQTTAKSTANKLIDKTLKGIGNLVVDTSKQTSVRL